MTNTKHCATLAAWLAIATLGTAIGGAQTRKQDVVAGQETLVLDVAMDARTVAYSRTDAWGSGPQRGDTFVMNGYVYPGNVIPDGDTSYNFAPDADSSIGTITVTGMYTVDAASIAAGVAPFAASTHSVSLYSADGLVTQGPDGANEQIRALLGGIGVYAGAVGQVTQQVLGTNGTGGVNLRLTIRLVRLNPQDNSQTPEAMKPRVTKTKAPR